MSLLNTPIHTSYLTFSDREIRANKDLFEQLRGCAKQVRLEVVGTGRYTVTVTPNAHQNMVLMTILRYLVVQGEIAWDPRSPVEYVSMTRGYGPIVNNRPAAFLGFETIDGVSSPVFCTYGLHVMKTIEGICS